MAPSQGHAAASIPGCGKAFVPNRRGRSLFLEQRNPCADGAGNTGALRLSSPDCRDSNAGLSGFPPGSDPSGNFAEFGLSFHGPHARSRWSGGRFFRVLDPWAPIFYYAIRTGRTCLPSRIGGAGWEHLSIVGRRSGSREVLGSVSAQRISGRKPPATRGETQCAPVRATDRQECLAPARGDDSRFASTPHWHEGEDCGETHRHRQSLPEQDVSSEHRELGRTGVRHENSRRKTSLQRLTNLRRPYSAQLRAEKDWTNVPERLGFR